MGDVELLQQLIDARFSGNQAAFARAIERQPAQISQYLKGRRVIGLQIKIWIERKLDLPGYFDGAAMESTAEYRTQLGTVGIAIRRIGESLLAADQLTRDQAKPLLEALTKHPELAADIAERMERLLKSQPEQLRAEEPRTAYFRG